MYSLNDVLLYTKSNTFMTIGLLYRVQCTLERTVYILSNVQCTLKYAAYGVMYILMMVSQCSVLYVVYIV